MIGLLPILKSEDPRPRARAPRADQGTGARRSCRPALLLAAMRAPKSLLPLGLALGLLLAPAPARALVGDISVADGPPGTEITLTHDATGESVTAETDIRGRAVLPLIGRNWKPGRGTLTYRHPRTGAMVRRRLDIADGSRLTGLDYEQNEGESERHGFSTDRLSYGFGLGWAREIHDDSPGGAVALQGSITHPLCRRWHVGIGAGYYWLGHTQTTFEGVTGDVTLSATPLWGEVSYDLRVPDDASGFRPYLVAGGGPYWRRIGGDFKSENCACVDFGINLGFGLENITHQGEVGLGLEGRYHNVLQEGLSGFQMVSGLITARWR